MKHLCLYATVDGVKEYEIFLEIAFAKEDELAFFKIYKCKSTSIDLIYQSFICAFECNFEQEVVDYCEGVLKQKIDIHLEIPQEGLEFLKKR